MTAPIVTAVPAAGLRPRQFARACGISRTTYYQLSGALQPRTVRFGRAVVVIEDPRDYLARVAEIQKKSAETPAGVERARELLEGAA